MLYPLIFRRPSRAKDFSIAFSLYDHLGQQHDFHGVKDDVLGRAQLRGEDLLALSPSEIRKRIHTLIKGVARDKWLDQCKMMRFCLGLKHL